ncbi:MAG TPA: hypothetical protein VGM36_03090 [Rhizomicrobium sp.]|jgi:hypothetical protein
MTPPFHTERQGKRRSPRELASAAGVALLHVIVIAFLIRATYVNMPTHVISRAIETWFIFPPKPHVEPKPAHPQANKKPQRQIAPRTTTIPDYSHIDLAPLYGDKAQHGLNLSLFGCEPEHVAMLSAEDRAKCPSVAAASRDRDKDAVDYTDHTDRSQGRALWERGRARKNAPALLPCASPQAAGVSLGTLLCLAKGLSDGFDPDNQPGYMDKSEPIHVPNNGDPSVLKTPLN